MCRGGFLGSCRAFSVTEGIEDAMWAFVQRVTKQRVTLVSLLTVQLSGPTLLMKSHSLALSNNSGLPDYHIEQEV